MRLTLPTVLTNTELQPGLRLIEVHEPYLAQSARPGQFCMLRCSPPDASDPLLRRPYFVHGVQRERDQVSLLMTGRGRGGSWLEKQAPGAVLDILGPAGHGWEIGEGTRNLLLVGEGHMLTSLTMLAQVAVEQDLAVTLISQAAREQDFYPPALLTPEIEYHSVLSSGSPSLVDLVGDYLAWADAVYLALWDHTTHALYTRYDRLRREHFAQVLVTRPFACGNGVCLTCALETNAGPKLVCRDGPVFPLGDIM